MLKRIKVTGLAFFAIAAVTIATALLPVSASAAPKPLCTASGDIKYGSLRDDCVRYIQQIVNSIGNSKQWYLWEWVPIDGRFGPRTEKQVKGFQATATHGSLIVDGRVGPKTWREMCLSVHDYWIGNGGDFRDYRDPDTGWIAVGRYWVANNALDAADDAGCAKYDAYYDTVN